MRSKYFLPLLVLFLFLLDLYVFQGVSAAVSPYPSSVQMGIFIGFWIIALACWVIVLKIPRWRMAAHAGFRMVLLTLMLGVYLGELLAAVFFLIDDLRRGGLWIAAFIDHGAGGPDLPRSLLLSRLGVLAGAGLVVTLIYGFSNKYDYKIRRITLHFPHLPAAFKGLKIVQLSDIHSGSFDHYKKVERGVELALAENADLIFFTGDLVNNSVEELSDYQQLFSRLRAPLGVYAILGNHDYGDYREWPTETAKTENLQRLKDLEAEMGWKMLNNTHVLLEKDGQQIAVIGVENWSSKARFPKYGDLQKAYAGTRPVPFKILLSHDPSHWDAQVRPDYPDIDLMLAGHTHGMQFGLEIPGFRWSPIQWVYKQWAGLYRQGDQYLYVNRGFGFLGYPGRVGIRPEITVIELV